MVFQSCRSAENMDALERTFCSKVAEILFPTSSPPVFSVDNCHPMAALWEYARLYQFVTSVDSRCLAQRPFDLFSRAWTSITLYSINTMVTQYRYNINAFVSLNLKSYFTVEHSNGFREAHSPFMVPKFNTSNRENSHLRTKPYLHYPHSNVRLRRMIQCIILLNRTLKWR